MTVATIVDVMESWPLGLRLRFEGESSDELRDLAEGCEIKRAEASADPADLRVGMRVSVDRAALVLHHVEILLF